MNTNVYQPQTKPAPILDGSPNVKEREVPTALGKINFALDQLAASVAQLHKRLEPLIRPEPATNPSDKPGSMISSPLACTLDNVAERILSEQRNLSSIEERIQV